MAEGRSSSRENGQMDQRTTVSTYARPCSGVGEGRIVAWNASTLAMQSHKAGSRVQFATGMMNGEEARDNLSGMSAGLLGERKMEVSTELGREVCMGARVA